MSLFWRDETVRWRHRKGDAVGDMAGFCGREQADECVRATTHIEKETRKAQDISTWKTHMMMVSGEKYIYMYI